MLLYLVGRNKMNLYDINIMELIDQYTATIRNLQDNRMEVASEFIDMAAHLVQMKKVPCCCPGSPEAERMKAELTGRLIEYSACKEVAAKLGSRARDLYTAVRQPMPLVGAAEYTRRHDPNLLVTAWFNLMGATCKRNPHRSVFEPLVTAPFVSVSSRVSHMLRGLLKAPCKDEPAFHPEDSRSTHVATFLALLELIRAGRIKVKTRASPRTWTAPTAETRRLPPMNEQQKIGALEAMLFAHADPVEAARLADALRVEPRKLCAF